MIDWDSPTWGRNDVHEASNGSWIDCEEGYDES